MRPKPSLEHRTEIRNLAWSFLFSNGEGMHPWGWILTPFY